MITESALEVDRSIKLAIIIPCLNEAGYIGRLLCSLEQQTRPANQIVVADCYSTDATLQQVDMFLNRLPLAVVESKRSVGAARNSGVEQVKPVEPDYLVFIDADMQVAPSFLKQVEDTITEQAVDFITPRFSGDGRGILNSWLVHNVDRRNRRAIRHQNTIAGVGGLMIVKKSIHDKIGGFPEGVREDQEYINHLNLLGASAYYAHSIVAVHGSRREQIESPVRWILGTIPDDSVAGKTISLITGDRYKKKYGHYS